MRENDVFVEVSLSDLLGCGFEVTNDNNDNESDIKG